MKKLLLIFMFLPSLVLASDTIITITIPDANNAEMLQTIRYISGNQNMTSGEAKAFIKGSYIDMLKRWVIMCRENIARQSIVSPDNFAQ